MVILVIVRFLATVCHKINFLAPPKVLLTLITRLGADDADALRCFADKSGTFAVRVFVSTP